MIDNFALGVTHGLMLLAAFLLLKRGDLDSEAASDQRPARFGAKRARPGRPPRA